MIKKINYENKVAIQNDEDIENKNKVTDADMNEIKEVVNNNADELSTVQENISDIQEEQETQNTKIETLETDNTTNKKDISDIKTKNNEQDTNIEELQENLENTKNELSDAQQEIDALRTIQNALPTVDGEGENVKLVGTAENVPFKEFKIGGNSKQETRNGYNKFNAKLFSNQTQAGATQTIQEDGTITISGTGKTTANYNGTVSNTKIPLSLKVGKLYAKMDKQSRPAIYCRLFNDANETIQTFNNFHGSIDTSIDITQEMIDAGIYLHQYIYMEKDLTIIPNSVKVMIYQDGDGTYEQYGASPSPDFSSKIEVVGDDANQFNKDEVVLKDGYYSSVDGSFVTSTATCHTENYIEVISNTNYILSRFKRHSSSYNYPSVYAIYFYDNEKNWISRTSVFYTSNSAPINEYLEYQFKTPSGCRYIRFQCQTTEINLDLETIKLQKGEKATAYSKFGEGTASAKISNKNIARNITYFNTKNQYASMVNLEYYFEKDKNYRISFDTPNTGIQIYLQAQGDNVNYSAEGWQNCYCDGKRHSFKVTARKTKNTKLTWGLILRNTATSDVGSGLLSNLMIEEVESTTSSATDYVEHQEQNFTMPVQKEMLENDYFDLDTLEEVHNWNEIDVSTLLSKDIAIGSESTDEYYVFQIPLCSETQRAKEVLCEKFKFLGFETASISRKEEGITINTDAKRFGRVWIKASRLSEKSITAFLNWCSEENIIVKVLIEDVEERLPMTDEQKEIAKQIKNTLVSYKDTTHVYSEDAISPIFKCSAIADMTAMLNNLQAQILANEEV